MANTICLSTDMNSLYIITNESDAPQVFALSGHGVDLTLSNGNITGARATSSPSGSSLPLSDAQYSIEFVSSVSKVAIIGVADIITGLQAEEMNKSIASGTVNVRNDGTNIILA